MYRPYTCYATDEAAADGKGATTFRAKTFIIQDPAQSKIIAEVREERAERDRRTTDSTAPGERVRIGTRPGLPRCCSASPARHTASNTNTHPSLHPSFRRALTPDLSLRRAWCT